MTIKKQFILGVALASVFTACSDSDVPSAPVKPVSGRISLNVRSFGEAERVEDTLTGYTTLNGYFFADGKLSTQYIGLTADDARYSVEIPGTTGTLYFVANPSSEFTDKVTSQLAQEAFLKLTAGREGIDTAAPMTASIELNSHSEFDNLSATLTRAIARIDAQPLSENVTITGITLKEVVQNGYYFSQSAAATANGGTTTLSRSFDTPLATLQTGVFYLYEQAGSIPVEVQAQVNGQPRTFNATLPATIERNHIYTVKVTSTSVLVSVSVGVGEWEQGEDTLIDADN